MGKALMEFIEERLVFSLNNAEVQEPIWKKINLNSFFTLLTKGNSRYTTDVNAKTVTIKFLGENIEKHFNKLG